MKSELNAISQVESQLNTALTRRRRTEHVADWWVSRWEKTAATTRPEHRPCVPGWANTSTHSITLQYDTTDNV